MTRFLIELTISTHFFDEQWAQYLDTIDAWFDSQVAR